MTGGMDGGSRGGGPERDQRQLSRGPVSGEVQEQVEVWILNIEKLLGLNIYSHGSCIERGGWRWVKRQFDSQTGLKENCKELFNWVL